MADQCSTCFFGQRFQWTSGQYTRVCCANAPYAVAFPSGPAKTLGVVQHLWPPVRDDDWCGDGISVWTGAAFTPLAKWPWYNATFYGAGSFFAAEPIYLGSLAVPALAGAGALVADAYTTPYYATATFAGAGAVQAPVQEENYINAVFNGAGDMQSIANGIDVISGGLWKFQQFILPGTGVMTAT